MKKLFLGLAVVAGSFAFGQQFGAKAGLNVSSISKGGYDDTKAKVGYYAGVFLNAPISGDFSIQPEVLYNNLGSKTIKDAGILGKAETKLNLDYISVPVMFQYKATPQFYLEAGPEFSFLVGANAKTSYETPLKSGQTVTELNKDNFNSFNFGMGLGLGFDITPNIGVNARYVAGFTDISKNGTTSASDNTTNKNNTFQVGLGVKF
ncbi:PorT family protein [Riemerella anatipestifer]|uniref:porin family protein n=1 Tax=Riemerella anatipestifer TaxID=34085 RepID=UPI00129D968D|nr:porin family protein [Riemerella anatipestifer]MRM97466.1 PorT family protein [Riemerella anatipestifer]MRN00752.1 PorT family protein [Riemerella anatipestifer]MRN02942.1 PorT family protein [Riemerella anatipestifer]